MPENLLLEIRTARLRVVPLALWDRRQLVRRVFSQLEELRDAGLSGYFLKENRHLNRLLKSSDITVAQLPRLADGEFGRMLAEFELLLTAMTDVIKTVDDTTALN